MSASALQVHKLNLYTQNVIYHTLVMTRTVTLGCVIRADKQLIVKCSNTSFKRLTCE